MTRYHIQTRSKTKTVTGDWFDFLGPYESEGIAIETVNEIKSKTPREFRIIKRVDYIIETGVKP